MKHILLFCLVTFSSTLFAQEIIGDWYGDLKVSSLKLRIVLHVTKTDTGFLSTLDSPDQGAQNIPMTVTSFDNDTLIIESNEMKSKFIGVLADTLLIGTFTQAGREIPITLSREKTDEIEVIRPQEPTGKPIYKEIEVSFKNKKDNVTLAGTLTLPKGRGPFKTAILISGSGPQNRDEKILGHKPFLVIADYLTNNGIAVLRYDDRGVGKSTGDFSAATSLDFARDVECAIDFLKHTKRIDRKNIGLIGHSEGGLIAPIVASNPENDVAFAILLAGPGIRGLDIIYAQQALIAKADGKSEEEIDKNGRLSREIFTYLENNQSNPDFNRLFHSHIDSVITAENIEIPKGMQKLDFVKSQVAAVSNPWMKLFLFYDPKESLEQLKCPVLALNGSKDLQVPAKENLRAIKEYVTSNGNKNVTIIELEGLNHLFQTANTGSPSEYAVISETFSADVLLIMTEWLQKLNK